MLRQVHRLIHVHGIRGTAFQAWRWLGKLRHLRTPDPFDAEYGVSTSGASAGGDMRPDRPEHRWLATRSRPTDPAIFTALIDSVPIDFPRYTFIDCGCGKGRALMLASRYPFKRIIGVEISRDVLQQAARNLDHWHATACQDIALEWSDITAFTLPLDPLVLFLFHPCEGPVLERFAQRVAESLREYPRPCIVLYHNPRHADAWTRAGFTVAGRGPRWTTFTHDLEAHR